MGEINTGLWADFNETGRLGYCDYPTIWDFDFVQSLKTEFVEGGPYASQRDKLKEKVRMMLNDTTTDPLVQLENVDILQRLGVSYHFEDEIKKILDAVHSSNDFESGPWKDNLYATALKFRVLRHYRYSITHEIFNAFKDESGKFKECFGDDVKTLLSLYEASFHLMHGESILDEAREFASKHLQEFVKQNEDKESYLSVLVGHALETPLHWRVPRFEARWFIELCKKNRGIINPIFLELSILDYNIVQSIHQEELKDASRWWKDLRLKEKMNFFRERVVENIFWLVATISEPQHAYCRKMVGNSISLFAVLDDAYDTYCKLEELAPLTAAFESWDLKAIEPLPNYLQISFLATYNYLNDLAYTVLKEQGLNVIKYINEGTAGMIKGYFQESKYKYSGKIPTLDEYINNAIISSGTPILLAIAFFSIKDPITKEALKLFDGGFPSIVLQSALVNRLTNDLGTDSYEKKKGDAPTSVACHMHDTGVSEEEARRHVFHLVTEAWKQINEDRIKTSEFSMTFIECVANLTRSTMWLYDGRDGFGLHNHGLTKEQCTLVFAEPIPLED